MTAAQLNNLTEYLARKHKVTSSDAVELCRESIGKCSHGFHEDLVWGSLTAGDVVQSLRLRPFLTSHPVRDLVRS